MGKSSLISRLISNCEQRLLVGDQDSAVGDTMVPIEVSFSETDHILVTIIPLSRSSWTTRRVRYALFLLDKEEKKQKEQVEYLKNMFETIYGAPTEETLKQLASPNFMEPETIFNFLDSQESFLFPADGVDANNCIAAYGAEGGLHHLVDRIEVKGRFNIPESVVMVDLPGTLDATKTKWWLDDLNRELKELDDVWWLTDEKRVGAVKDVKCIAQTLQLQAKPTYLVVGHRDTPASQKPERLQRFITNYFDSFPDLHFAEKVLSVGKYVPTGFCTNFSLEDEDPQKHFGIKDMHEFLKERYANDENKGSDKAHWTDLDRLVQVIDSRTSIPASDPRVDLGKKLEATLDLLMDELVAKVSSTTKKIKAHVGLYQALHGNTLPALFAPYYNGEMRTRSEHRPEGLNEDLDFYQELGMIIHDQTIIMWTKFVESSNGLLAAYNVNFRNICIQAESYKSIVQKQVVVTYDNLGSVDWKEVVCCVFSELYDLAKDALRNAKSKLPSDLPQPTYPYQQKLSELLDTVCGPSSCAGPEAHLPLKIRSSATVCPPLGSSSPTDIWEPVDEKLRKLGLERIPTEGRGNCAILALCFGLGIEGDAPVVRDILVDFLTQSEWDLEPQAIGTIGDKAVS